MLGDLKSCCDATAYLTAELRVGAWYILFEIATSELECLLALQSLPYSEILFIFEDFVITRHRIRNNHVGQPYKSYICSLPSGINNLNRGGTLLGMHIPHFRYALNYICCIICVD